MCGATDATLDKLRHSRHRANRFPQTYHCRHGYPSVLLQVIAGHKKILGDVSVKALGGTNDATYFRDSLLYNRLTSGDAVWDKVMNVRGKHVRPYVFGDWCFPLLPFLLTPFSPNGMGTPAQNLFDGMLMKGELWKEPDENGKRLCFCSGEAPKNGHAGVSYVHRRLNLDCTLGTSRKGDYFCPRNLAVGYSTRNG